MENFTPVSALTGGALIGISATLLLLFNGRMAGVSGIMNGVFNASRSEMSWRLAFLAGLVIGAFLFKRMRSAVPPVKKIRPAASCDFLHRRSHGRHIKMASAY